ncbi:serine/threonine protein phosphatase type 5, putative [Trypanosoma cruzi marinkellei]|uniref:Serine/threonine protein phosphatase type 5, putative n=1 Tax=Trypanosoma cruzi marinkellei TaxID=85056 RepID=K2N9P6_TRYCR|nr:serine/threonine protein phosphatase type 5, putative [Trypanosoma cruzi marinkellei]
MTRCTRINTRTSRSFFSSLRQIEGLQLERERYPRDMSSHQQDESKAPSRQAVEEWLERIDDIAAAVEEILREDPMEATRRRQEREARLRQMQIDERKEKMKMRYDPRHYVRFESDEFIDKLLKEAEVRGETTRREVKDESLYTRAERVSLEEALRLKDDAAKAVRASEWERACELYTTAIRLNVVDTELQRTLRNNRALVQLKLKRYLDAVDDTSYVLREEPMNVKALLRRATALRHLHRPVDALKDVEEALKKDAASQEAGDLAQWLRRVKREHSVCAVFQHRQPEEAKCLENSIKMLTSAVKELHKCGAIPTGGSVANKESEENAEKKALMQAAESVRRCLGVVQMFHQGAAVFFLLLDGLNPLIELVCKTIIGGWSELVVFITAGSPEQMSACGMTFVVSARLLALVLLGSQIGVEGIELSTVASLVRKLVDVLSIALQQKFLGRREGATLTLTVAILQVLEGLATRCPIPVHAQCNSLLLEVWEVMTKMQPSPQLLFFYCGILEALLREPSVCVSVAKEMEEILPHAIEMAIEAGPGQLKEVGLSLAVRATCVSSVCAKRLGSSELTRTLSKVLPLFQEENRDAPVSPRVEEGLYAVVYNVLLQAESRSQYVAQWKAVTDPGSSGDFSFSLHTWRTLREQVLAEGKSTRRITVHAKMMAVLAKFFHHDEALRGAMLEGEEILWAMLCHALSGLEPLDVGPLAAADNKTLANRTEDEEKEGEVEAVIAAAAAAWELVEHATTCIASHYSQNLPLREKGLSTADRIAVLMQIIRRAGPQHVVALGNAALIASFVPSASCSHFAALNGVDVLLEGLRSVRDLLFRLEHDGKRGSTQWIHSGAAQKNLAIALSRCCVVESQRERLRELKGFETLHAVLESHSS